MATMSIFIVKKKKRVYARQKTRAPSLFAKTAFDPSFIDSLAIDERGGGGKLESEIQLSKTIFFFFKVYAP